MRVKSEEKRQAILEIAKDSFKKQGFEQTSMSYIAKELGDPKRRYTTTSALRKKSLLP